MADGHVDLSGVWFSGPTGRANAWSVVPNFSPRGDHLGALPVIWGGERFMLRKPQNVAFAGPGKRTLYIVGSDAVFKVQTLAQGVQNRAK